jgi:hypothetical protein
MVDTERQALVHMHVGQKRRWLSYYQSKDLVPVTVRLVRRSAMRVVLRTWLALAPADRTVELHVL